MEPIIQSDHANKRHVAMWDACGIRYRSNICQVGGGVGLHAHAWAHPVHVMSGIWDVETVSPTGEAGAFVAASAESECPESVGNKFEIPAFWKHKLTLRNCKLPVGEFVCHWPIGAEQ